MIIRKGKGQRKKNQPYLTCLSVSRMGSYSSQPPALSLFLCVAANSGGRGSSSPSPEAAAHPLPLKRPRGPEERSGGRGGPPAASSSSAAPP